MHEKISRGRCYLGAIQMLTERRVVAFMSDNHIDPDMAVEVFVLEPGNGETEDSD